VTQAVRGLPGGRALRAMRRDIPFLTVVACLAAAFVYVRLEPQHWLRGVLAIGIDLIAAGTLRLLLPTRRAGLLAVRGRAFDVVVYVGLGVLVITFGLALPK
jgi:Protein of unknown function (DUF3017)